MEAFIPVDLWLSVYVPLLPVVLSAGGGLPTSPLTQPPIGSALLLGTELEASLKAVCSHPTGPRSRSCGSFPISARMELANVRIRLEQDERLGALSCRLWLTTSRKLSAK